MYLSFAKTQIWVLKGRSAFVKKQICILQRTKYVFFKKQICVLIKSKYVFCEYTKCVF